MCKSEWRFNNFPNQASQHLILLNDDLCPNVEFLDPYCQILEKSSRNFCEISVFRGVTQTDSWQTHPVIFSNFNFRDMSWTDFWKIHPSIFWRPIQFLYLIGVRARPISGKLIQNNICCVLDEFSGNRPVSRPKILKLTVGWVFQRSV